MASRTMASGTSWRRITAVVRLERLESVEQALQRIGAPGVTVSYVKGFGEYANFFASPPVVREARLEVVIEPEQVETIVGAIAAAAHTGTPGDGVIAVSPVEAFHRIRELGRGEEHPPG